MSNQKSKIIALAEDDEEDVDFFKDALSEIDVDAHLTVVKNGMLLINHLENTHELPDIIFMDLNMPYKNGIQCLEEIKTADKWKGIKTIILSTSSNKDQIKELYDMGADFYLTKPASFTELKKQLFECIQQFD